MLLVAFWALVTGIVELVMAFRSGETAGERALFGLTGLVSIALGVVLIVRPDVGAVTLAQVYGFFSIVYGIAALGTGAGRADPPGGRSDLTDQPAIQPERPRVVTGSGG